MNMNTPAFTTPCNGFSQSTFTGRPRLSNATPLRPIVAQRPPSALPVPAPVSMASEVNIAKKAAKVDKVKAYLSESQLILSVPLDGISVAQVTALKKSMPAGTSLMTIKNTLMRRAITDTEWAPADDLLKDSSLWIFVKDDGMKDTLKVYKQFLKDNAREASIRGGVFEGTRYDEDGIEKVAALPSKKELITKIAIGIKAVPTKIGRAINAVPTKVGRAVKLAFAEEDGEGSAPDS